MDSDGVEDAKSNAKIFVHLPIKTPRLLSDDDIQDQLDEKHTTKNTKIPRFFTFAKPDTPTVKFQHLSKDNDVLSRSNNKFGGSFRGVFSRKIDWISLKTIAKKWLKNPTNIILLIWILCVAISGAILFLVMTGMLNHALPKKSQRNAWFEVNNQILNALFTLMALYQHPKRVHHFVLLSKWRPEDVSRLRAVYSKNASYTPRARVHIMVVVVLLNLNCLAQYALCGLTVGYRRSERPAIGVGITLFVAFSTPAVAGVYSVISPLGKDYDMDTDIASDEESQVKKDNSGFEKRFAFALKDGSGMGLSDLQNPTWSGGIFDFWDDISSAYLSLFCSFCVFGWNMERLGFGNMYVHIATFLLFCLAPFWIFTLAAINIDNDNVRMAMTITGVFLCVFGLLYGGFWRIKMRKRFNLSPSNVCFGKSDIADFAAWLCCCWCALAQEVRTGNSYDIIVDKFYKGPDPGSCEIPILPLPREREHLYYRSSFEQGGSSGNDAALEPPLPSQIHRDVSY